MPLIVQHDKHVSWLREALTGVDFEAAIVLG